MVIFIFLTIRLAVLYLMAVDSTSGAGTNLKVGAPVRRKCRIFLPLYFFGSKSTITV